MTALVNPGQCPVCGQGNMCARVPEQATGTLQPPCWCTAIDFSTALLTRVPTSAKGKACICQACAIAGARSVAAVKP